MPTPLWHRSHKAWAVQVTLPCHVGKTHAHTYKHTGDTHTSLGDWKPGYIPTDFHWFPVITATKISCQRLTWQCFVGPWPIKTGNVLSRHQRTTTRIPQFSASKVPIRFVSAQCGEYPQFHHAVVHLNQMSLKRGPHLRLPLHQIRPCVAELKAGVLRLASAWSFTELAPSNVQQLQHHKALATNGSTRNYLLNLSWQCRLNSSASRQP